jgi:non-specific serine/threonine protein kinase
MGAPAVIHSNLLVYQQEYEQQVSQKLGDKAFTAARSRGRSLGFDAAIAYALHEQTPSATSPVSDTSPHLTKRERQVAELIAEGLTNPAIANRLVISPRTAQGHVEHILAKLGFTSRTQIAGWVVEHTRE